MSDLLSRFKVDTPAKRWLEMHLEHQDREFCLIWPFARAQNGYGVAGRAGYIRPHRIMCEHRHGPPPSPAHQAAHSCDRGHHACVNPWHLDWKTPSENQCDRFRGQPPKKREKLTPEQVDEIRLMKSRERTVDTAARFGVTEANIRQIQAGKIWKLESRRHLFSTEEILRIRAEPETRGIATALAKEFNVSHSTIHRIRVGKAHRYVTDPASAHQRGEP